MPAKSTKVAAAKKTATTSEEPSMKIGGKVSLKQVEKACSALAAHRQKMRSSGSTSNNNKNELPLDGEDDDEGDGARSNPSDVVWMQITVKTLNVNAPAKPIRISTPNPIYPASSSICLLTADPQRTYKDLMVQEKLTQVKRVVGVVKLKGKFKPYEARRQLMNDHDLFLCDDRIVPMLPKLLGKKWMEERKSPIPVRLTKTKDNKVRKEVEAALASTFFHRNKGTCTSVRLGTLYHLTPEQLAENVAAALPTIVSKHIKSGWQNVQSIDIKTGTSAALPVWNCNINERWEGLPEPKSKEDEEAEGKETTESVKEVKSKKRLSNSSDKQTPARKVAKKKSS